MLRLTGKVELPPGEVRVTVERVAGPAAGAGVVEVLEQIRREQTARGHRPRTAEEIDADVKALRDEWDERAAEIEKLQEECRREREKPGC
jgi:hypothetical protein